MNTANQSDRRISIRRRVCPQAAARKPPILLLTLCALLLAPDAFAQSVKDNLCNYISGYAPSMKVVFTATSNVGPRGVDTPPFIPKVSPAGDFETPLYSGTWICKITSDVDEVSFAVHSPFQGGVYSLNYMATHNLYPGDVIPGATTPTPAVSVGLSGFIGGGVKESSVSLGIGALATNDFSVAIGYQARSTNTAGTAVGYSALAGGLRSVAVGREATAIGSRAVAIGASAVATHDFSTAIGRAATSTAANQIVLGTSGEWVYVPGAAITLSATSHIHFGAASFPGNWAGGMGGLIGFNSDTWLINDGQSLHYYDNGANAKILGLGESSVDAWPHLTIKGIGSKLRIKESSEEGSMGTNALVNGTVTVLTAAVASNSRIFLSTLVPSGTVGHPYIRAITNATSFVITNTSTSDNSIIAWMIVDPAP